jgi:hypothetical protein
VLLLSNRVTYGLLACEKYFRRFFVADDRGGMFALIEGHDSSALADWCFGAAFLTDANTKGRFSCQVYSRSSTDQPLSRIQDLPLMIQLAGYMVSV